MMSIVDVMFGEKDSIGVGARNSLVFLSILLAREAQTTKKALRKFQELHIPSK